MNGDDCVYLFYDKAVGNDHGYNNKLTKDITIDNMFSSNYQFFEEKSAIIEFNKFGQNYELPKDLDLTLYYPYVFSYSVSGAKIKVTIIGVNKKLLEKYVTEKKEIPNKQFLITLCNYHTLYNKTTSGIDILDKKSVESKIEDTTSKIIKNSMIPNADPTDPIEEQPEFAKVPLYDYQKRTIKWMLNREREEKSIYYNINDETIIGNVVYDSVKQEFAMAHDRLKLLFRGGALIDEVGLGKTYQMISVALSNQAKNINYVQDKYTGLFSKATLVICPNQLSGQWIRELEKVISEKFNLIALPFFTKNHLDKYTYQDLLDADFVITSFNFLGNKCFLDQWISKLSTKKSYLTSTNYSYKECDDILRKMRSDLKKKTSNIFESKPNLLLIHWHRIVVDEFHEVFTVLKYGHVEKLLQLFEGNYKWCMTATPFDKKSSCLVNMMDFITNYSNPSGNQILLNDQIFDQLDKKFFRRNTKKSVVTEYSLPPIKDVMVSLDFSKTEWMMYNAYLANPNVDRFSVLVRQICCHPKIADEIKGTLSNCKTLDDIENMMVKHYETQMKKAHAKVKYIEYRIKLTQKKIKIMQWKRQRKFLRQMGYKVKVNFKDDDEDEDYYKELEKQIMDDPDLSGLFLGGIDDNKDPFEDNSDSDDDKKSNKKLFVISDDNQDKILSLIGDDLKKDIPLAIVGLRETQQNFEVRLATYTKDYAGKKSTYDYFYNVMSKLKKTTENIGVNELDSDSDSDSDDDKVKCAVCMGSVKGTDMGVTKCGHIFCYNCVKPFIEKSLKCPSCQKHVKSDEIYMITQPAPEVKTSKEFQDKQTLIGKVGTKLANLIFFLKKNDKHAIIFSQWDDLLKKVGEVLNDYGIKNAFCKGNVWQRDKAIREFNNNDDIKVIMLSSESAASGTNLTKAEMVILLDPVYGTYEYRRNTEWQAIGRAYRMGQTKQVQVVRFVIKNTVEDEIYKMNQEQDKKANTQTKIFELTDDKITLEKKEIEEIVGAAIEAEKKKVIKAPKKTNVVKKIAKKQVIVNDSSGSESEFDSDDNEPVQRFK
jgi:SNF2 family DNA or RNA helicase